MCTEPRNCGMLRCLSRTKKRSTLSRSASVDRFQTHMSIFWMSVINLFPLGPLGDCTLPVPAWPYGILMMHCQANGFCPILSRTDLVIGYTIPVTWLSTVLTVQ